MHYPIVTITKGPEAIERVEGEGKAMPIQKFCPFCITHFPQFMKYCPECGTPIKFMARSVPPRTCLDLPLAKAADAFEAANLASSALPA